MASIFTFDPDPPRVSSPWSVPTPQDQSTPAANAAAQDAIDDLPDLDFDSSFYDHSSVPEVDRLEAEPQSGPTEYKLHLLLRRRRSFVRSTTPKQESRRQNKKSDGSHGNEGGHDSAIPPYSSSSVSRQHRLEQLTTQLLWRLQQSSPFHASKIDETCLPALPDVTGNLELPIQPKKLSNGLEESKGALYELGVSDDGTFVGLAQDEMAESINNLRIMAACLGCSVQILRMVPIGECEWIDPASRDHNIVRNLKKGKLYVAEAYIKPELSHSDDHTLGHSHEYSRKSTRPGVEYSKQSPNHDIAPTAHEQLRVSLIGATMCGKSSLLGTVSTSTMDNGRGKSRLSLLKHRHEIASGMTSSVSQELVGYVDVQNSTESNRDTKVVNYATPNVESWNDIHHSSRSGRLVLLSDSAGHPRYRRTTVRGLLGWAPHWTVLCIAANDGSDCDINPMMSGLDPEAESFVGASAHVSMAHLDLCLRLQVPLVVVVTKLDTASKSNFSQILSTLLSALKASGRRPIMLSNENRKIADSLPQNLSQADLLEIKEKMMEIREGVHEVVPIVLTSAVQGSNIGKLHALLRSLPLDMPYSGPKNSGLKVATSKSDPPIIFHVDDNFVFNIPMQPQLGQTPDNFEKSLIISGRVARGQVRIGDQLLLGPFAQPSSVDKEEAMSGPKDDSFLAPRSFTDALAKATSSPRARGLPTDQEWKLVKITSIRNLRLPVEKLRPDHVGTLGIAPVDGSVDSLTPIRRGMVLINGDPRATHTLTASFDISDAGSVVVGGRVVIYTASVRASAKVVTIALQRERPNDDPQSQNKQTPDDVDSHLGLEKELLNDAQYTTSEGERIMVTFQLEQYREWVEQGARILVMPGGGPGFHTGERGGKGLGGLEGFVGYVVETFG
ncbi:MAG: hypothetical protein M1831_006456 [Alyxoria varia]|nr:MAG: hypothetical protein M1831_006456 [Alyxoria varia]